MNKRQEIEEILKEYAYNAYSKAYPKSDREKAIERIENLISQTKQELIEEAKQKILKIPDETICPDKYYKKYTNNWRSQHTRNPSGRAWIMWFLENYLTNE